MQSDILFHPLFHLFIKKNASHSSQNSCYDIRKLEPSWKTLSLAQNQCLVKYLL